MEETMLDLTLELLVPIDSMSFENIWKKISKKLLKTWIKIFDDRNEEFIMNRKKGELYKLLTLDGRFIRVKSGDWALSRKFTYEEIQKLIIFTKETLE